MNLPAPDSAQAFAFAVVRPGAEAALKREAAARGLALAFSRPGLVTLKDPRGAVTPDFGADLVHARVAGSSLGRFADAASIADAVAHAGPLGLHVFARPLPEDTPPDAAPARLLEAELAARLGARRVDALAPGTLVLDVVVHAGESLFAGLHRHGEGRSRAPGGAPEVRVPPLAPSRAYAKLREALELAGEAMRPGELAVELGSAPGGITLAMLEEGVSVIGVDPGAMDPGVLAFTGPGGARVRHRKMPAGALAPGELPARIDWLVVDLNLAPPVALRYVARILRARPPRRGAVITLKMNDDAARAAIPEHLAAVQALGLPRIVARQLPANRSEITVIARPRR